MVKSCLEIFGGILRKPSALTSTYKLKLDQKTFYFEHQKNNSKTVTVEQYNRLLTKWSFHRKNQYNGWHYPSKHLYIQSEK